MLSLGIGLQKLVNRNLGRSGLFDTIIVTSRQDSRAPRFTQAAPSTQPKALDDAARHGFEQLANVAEVYPNFSAVGDIRLENAKGDGHFTVVGTLPQSASSSEAMDDVQGSFFSAPEAQETIILADFARDLLGIQQEQRNSQAKLTTDQANQLLGQYISLRYHTREENTAPPANSKQAKKPVAAAEAADQSGDLQDEDAQTFNLVPRQIRLKIVGIVTNEPNRGFRQGRTPVFLPLALAESMNMVQAGEQNVHRADGPCEAEQSGRAGGRRDQEAGLQHVFHRGRFKERDALLQISGSLSGHLRQHGARGGLARHCEHAGHGDPGAAARDRDHEGSRRQRR
jgi:hypothetical protein